MADRIVVMGGSFNPPTVGHFKLMQAAMDAVGGVIGIFVPASHEYVAKKMKKQQCRQDTLSEPVRLAMLESFCRKDKRMRVSKIQMEKKRQGHDFELLEEIQREYPDGRIYFVVGSDKLRVLPRWHRIDEFLEKFNILVAKRGEDDLEKIKEEIPCLARHIEVFTVFPVPEEISWISSSLFRERLRAQDERASELVTGEVWAIMNENGKIPWNSITDFHKEPYAFLSNFYEVAVTYGGLTYGSGEAAFQAQKCISEEGKRPFTEYSPSKSKGMGRRVQLRPDWEQVKTAVMEDVVRAKFAQHPKLMEQLLATGDKVLVEGNRWGDTCWGVDVRTGQGENRLGKILMSVREECRRAESERIDIREEFGKD